jgi:N-carbamoylputrescine amidase
MVRYWAAIERRTFQMTIFIRRSFILRRAILVFGFGIHDMAVGICWDQWFPETARCMALQGAELLFYPTAIGSEPLLGMDSSGHWQRCMQGHAAANLMPVIAANRIGTETVEPCEANQNQQSELTFYGTSFITDQTGAVLKQAGRTEDTVLLHTFDLDAIQKDRLEWGLFRDRRPEQYGAISSPIPVQI